MIDVLLVLIIIFMVITPLTPKGLELLGYAEQMLHVGFVYRPPVRASCDRSTRCERSSTSSVPSTTAGSGIAVSPQPVPMSMLATIGLLSTAFAACA